MVTTTQIKPAPLLQPFVNCYSLRVFDTGKDTLSQLIHALHQCYLSFFLRDKFCDLVLDSNVVQHWSSSLVSLFTAPGGTIQYRGNFAVFSVEFKVNGIFGIFGIPQKILSGTVITTADILGPDSSFLTEKLEFSKNIYEMAICMDTFLTKRLLQQKHKSYTIRVAHASNVIFKNKGIVSVDTLCSHVNMSFRNFERRFTEEVGMPPKLYARITRFYYALENKMMHPYKRWTSISYENGFFDQAHLIREIKTFSGKAPEELFADTPPPTENFLAKVEE